MLIACAFNYEAHTTEFNKLGRIPVLKARMNADLALAAIATEKLAGHDEDQQTVILEPSYGQLNYYAPPILTPRSRWER